MTISQIENILIDKVKRLNIFKVVESAGRKDIPVSTTHPAAFVFFVSDRDTGSNPRPVYEIEYEVVVINKNLRSEASAATDIYGMIDVVRDAINKKTLGITGIEPWTCVSREITQFDDGIIGYSLRFKTRQYLDVPVE